MVSVSPSFVLADWSRRARKRVEVSVRASGRIGDAEFGAITASLAACRRLVERGACPAGQVAPNSVPTGRGDAIAVRWLVVDAPLHVDDVDWRFFHIVANAIFANVDAVSDVRFREWKTPDNEDSPRSTWQFAACRDNAELATFPSVVEPLPFVATSEDAADLVKGRRCVVRLAAPAGRPALEALIRLMDEWARVVELRGYSSALQDSTVAVDALHAYDEYSAELVFSLFEASEAAWYALLNMLAARHGRTGDIGEVTIE
jgi:hypothetical protein